jgi:LysR family transcriptional regulator, transcriptional activator of the cysJI operon
MAQLESFRLRVFRAVAEHLNFHKAAEQLFLTQPAVTLQIKALESDLGVRLFDRQGGKVSLTRQGSILLTYANKLAALAAEAEGELGWKDRKVSVELCVGVSTTIAQYVFPRLMVAFLAENPNIDCTLHSGNTSQIVGVLLDGKVSIGLIEGPARDRGVRSEPFMEDELMLIAPPGTAFAKFSGTEFVKATLLIREQGSGSRQVVEAALKEAGFPLHAFRKVVTLDSTEAIKSAAEVGHGLGFASRWAISKELELGTLKVVKVEGIKVTRHFSLVTRAGPEPRGPAGALRTFALERARFLSDAPPTPTETLRSIR